MTYMPKRRKIFFNLAAVRHVELSIQKLLFGSRDLCLHATVHLLSEFRTNRPKWRRNGEENFQYGVRAPS